MAAEEEKEGTATAAVRDRRRASEGESASKAGAGKGSGPGSWCGRMGNADSKLNFRKAVIQLTTKTQVSGLQKEPGPGRCFTAEAPGAGGDGGEAF